ncbi:hypothetical protein PBI_JACE_81 [Gordonia phage Jace]|uniref:DUF6378 domain-containing protein n=1 Tax=Gordonia phage Jace TaxID=2182360 RepID=A0A2U8UJH4_9CAUD|nr:hypothetical protein HOT28_gp81 [Gordonia phage Jace]AWN03701.1 hypothetical protein PBI_JACE_81 [Gordonia phage Jace]
MRLRKSAKRATALETIGEAYLPPAPFPAGYGDPGADPADEWDAAAAETILEEAARIVDGTRAQDYGENSLPHVAAMWSAYLGVPVTGRMVGWMLSQMKMVRDLHKPKRDNPVDIAGYAHLADQADG